VNRLFFYMIAWLFRAHLALTLLANRAIILLLDS
jgi:hypothetical protein